MPSYQCGSYTDIVVGEWSCVLMERIQANKPSPGTEAALRHQIESTESGPHDYAPMTPQKAARAYWPRPSQMIAGFGALKSLPFKSVAAGDMDVYDVTFECGLLEWRIAPLTTDGKISGMAPRLLP